MNSTIMTLLIFHPFICNPFIESLSKENGMLFGEYNYGWIENLIETTFGRNSFLSYLYYLNTTFLKYESEIGCN